MLETERESGTVPVSGLTHVFDGSPAHSAMRVRMQEIACDPILRSFDADRVFLSRVERYTCGLASIKRLREIGDAHGLDENERRVLRAEGVPDALPTDLQYVVWDGLL